MPDANGRRSDFENAKGTIRAGKRHAPDDIGFSAAGRSPTHRQVRAAGLSDIAEPQLDDVAERADAGPRAILRVPEVLRQIAARIEPVSLAELSQSLDVPKSSLHRLLQTLHRGRYLTLSANGFQLGPEAFRLANLMVRAQQAPVFPACARPVLEWLSGETGDS